MSDWTASTEKDFYKGVTKEIHQGTVDGLWNSHACPEVYLLKIDVDGSESDVLEGAKNMLEHVQVLIVEVNSKELRNNLPKGFKWKTINGHDYIGTKI